MVLKLGRSLDCEWLECLRLVGEFLELNAVLDEDGEVTSILF